MIGEFTKYDGSFNFDQNAPDQSKIDITLSPSGIRTSSSLLDQELQGDKYFNTAKFPTIRFVSTKVTLTGEHTGDVEGNLTMLGVTNPVTLHVTFNRADYHPMTNMFVAGFSATAKLSRSNFGFTTLLPLVGDEVRLEVQTEGIDKDRKKKEALKH